MLISTLEMKEEEAVARWAAYLSPPAQRPKPSMDVFLNGRALIFFH
jgi:hypothetical protein